MRMTARLDRNAIAQRGLAVYGDEIRERMNDLSEAWDDVAEVIFTHEAAVFSAEGRTDEHPPWAALSEHYAAWKEQVAPGAPILELTRRLREQLTGESGEHYERREPTTLTIGSDYILPTGDDLGGLHAVGRSEDPPMPARSPFRITQDVSDDIGLSIADHVLDAAEE